MNPIQKKVLQRLLKKKMSAEAAYYLAYEAEETPEGVNLSSPEGRAALQGLHDKRNGRECAIDIPAMR